MSDGLNDGRVRHGEIQTLIVGNRRFKVQQLWTRWGDEWWEVRELGPFYGTTALTLRALHARIARWLLQKG